MEFKELMKHRKRMCESVKKDGHCPRCPIGSCNNGKGELCDTFIIEYPSEAEQIIIKWAAEHPEKTIMDDFFEKHPKALKISSSGIPVTCAKFCGYCKHCVRDEEASNCEKCWNQPLEE